jgi:hypothetical protein
MATTNNDLSPCNIGRGSKRRQPTSSSNGMFLCASEARPVYCLRRSMTSDKQPRAAKALAAVRVVIGLVLLLVPQGEDHNDAPVACLVLIPVFVFGIVSVSRLVWPGARIDFMLPPTLALPSLFRRPPPIVVFACSFTRHGGAALTPVTGECIRLRSVDLERARYFCDQFGNQT